jgi:hypothetical protein
MAELALTLELASMAATLLAAVSLEEELDEELELDVAELVP